MTNHQQRVEQAATAFTEYANSNPEMAYASEFAAIAMQQLITFVQEVDPGLTWAESTLLAAGLLSGLPRFITTRPYLIDSIKENAQKLKSERK